MDTNALKIYTDGSAFDNPGKRCGWGMVVEFPENLELENEELSDSVEGTTINRMELTAVIEAITYARKKCAEHKIQRVIIFSDSQYVTDNHSRAQYWRKDGWYNRYGKPIENSDLWKKFLSVMNSAGARIEIKWIQGKSSEVTKRVDKVAKVAAKGTIKKKDHGYVVGKISKPSTGGVSTLYDKGEGSAVIKIYRYKETQEEGLMEVKFEMCLADKTVMGDTKYTAYYRKVDGITEISRHHAYHVHFNENKKFPVFTVDEAIE